MRGRDRRIQVILGYLAILRPVWTILDPVTKQSHATLVQHSLPSWPEWIMLGGSNSSSGREAEVAAEGLLPMMLGLHLPEPPLLELLIAQLSLSQPATKRRD